MNWKDSEIARINRRATVWPNVAKCDHILYVVGEVIVLCLRAETVYALRHRSSLGHLIGQDNVDGRLDGELWHPPSMERAGSLFKLFKYLYRELDIKFM